VQLLERRVASGLLAEVALHPDERVSRPKICGKRIPCLAKLARYRRNEDSEFAGRHRAYLKHGRDFDNVAHGVNLRGSHNTHYAVSREIALRLTS